MILARRLTAAATASLLAVGAFFALSVVDARAQRAQVAPPKAAPTKVAQAPEAQTGQGGVVAPSSCESAAEVAVMPSPIGPWKGAPLRVIVAAEKPLQGELTLVAPNGSVAAKSADREGGPPYFWFAEVAQPAVGTWHATLTTTASGECATISHDIVVADRAPPAPHASSDGMLWPLRNTWNRNTENLYSAWIEKLFNAPLDAEPSWKALHEVLRDRQRNMLFNYLGLREDEINIVYRPDCADLPYFLRAYFAFKMGLPFGYTKCTRGEAGGPPKCFAWWNIANREPPPRPNAPPAPEDAVEPPPQVAASSQFGFFRQQPPPVPVSAPVAPPPAPAPKALGLVPGFAQYVTRAVADGVHSGTARTPLADENTDAYPVPLNQETLRPGAMYADPYGHVLVLVKRLPQTADTAGLFFAVDAQPDATVARKRFWRGNFLFATNPALGGPGFKRFRPIVREHGTLRRLTNAEIAKNADYGDFSLEQAKLSVEDFYDRMDDVMSPAPLDPERAMKEAIASFEEQVRTRVTSVENGRKYQAKGSSDAAMPDGPAIFETSGAWEDFATPSRDLRLLIAMDVVRFFPERVMRRPERYAMPANKSAADVKASLEQVLATELAARKFAYTRTDGSQWTLTLKDVLDRGADLEMAYNVNDCVELRWGAKDGSQETATCRRHAPAGQRAKMSEYRPWVHERRRPARGA